MPIDINYPSVHHSWVNAMPQCAQGQSILLPSTVLLSFPPVSLSPLFVCLHRDNDESILVGITILIGLSANIVHGDLSHR